MVLTEPGEGDESVASAYIPLIEEEIETEKEAEELGVTVNAGDDEDRDSRDKDNGAGDGLSSVAWKGTTLEGQPKLIRPLPRWTWNDFGMGIRMADLYNHVIRSVASTWWGYHDGVWIMDDKNGYGAQAYGKEAVWKLEAREARFYSEAQEIDAEGKKVRGSAPREKFIAWAESRQTKVKLAAGMICAASEPLLRSSMSEFDSHPNLLNCANGVLNLTTLEFTAHDPALLMTRITRASWTPGAECPWWDVLIKRQIPDEKERIFFEAALAYACLLDGNLLKRMLLLWGPRDSGKSRVVTILKWLLGSYAKSFDMSLFRGNHTARPRPDLVARLPCRLIICSEPNDGGVLHADVLKKMVGGDEMSGRNLWDNQELDRVPSFTPVLALNECPEVKGADMPLLRRLWVVPFNVTVPDAEQIENLPQLLQAEADGILQRLVSRLKDQDILATVPDRFRDAQLAAFNSMSPLTDFIDEFTVKDPAGIIANRFIGNLYQKWCDERNIGANSPERLNDVWLGRELGKLGWEAPPKPMRFEGKVQRVRVGRRLRSVAEGAAAYLHYGAAGVEEV